MPRGKKEPLFATINNFHDSEIDGKRASRIVIDFIGNAAKHPNLLNRMYEFQRSRPFFRMHFKIFECEGECSRVQLDWKFHQDAYQLARIVKDELKMIPIEGINHYKEGDIWNIKKDKLGKWSCRQDEIKMQTLKKELRYRSLDYGGPSR